MLYLVKRFPRGSPPPLAQFGNITSPTTCSSNMLLELVDEQRRCTLLGWSNRELIAQVHAFDLRPWGIPPKARIGLLLQPGLSSAVGLISATVREA